MNRCKCGVYTNFGMTCTRCADVWIRPSRPYDDEESEEVELEFVDLEELEPHEDEEED